MWNLYYFQDNVPSIQYETIRPIHYMTSVLFKKKVINYMKRAYSTSANNI